jgi:molybdenum cofactor cytidylyltransferase
LSKIELDCDVQENREPAQGEAPSVIALVLAAGLGARFDPWESKLLVDFGGRPLVRRAVEAALESRARSTIVVTGHASAEIQASLAGLPVVFAHNPDYSTGLASSLRVSLSRAVNSDGALILLGDMPGVTSVILDQLIGAFEKAPKGCVAAAPVYQGRRGNPVLLGRAIFARLATRSGDEGARRLLRSLEGVLDVPIDDEAVVADIDTKADLEALRIKTGLAERC